MAIKQLDEQLFISAQLSEADIDEVLQKGISAVICNRPDNEEAHQPSMIEIRAIFEQYGIKTFCYQPVIASSLRASDALAFNTLLDQFSGKVLAYCRTGTRCSLLWAIGQVQQGRKADEVIMQVKEKTGLDISNFADKLNV